MRRVRIGSSFCSCFDGDGGLRLECGANAFAEPRIMIDGLMLLRFCSMMMLMVVESLKTLIEVDAKTDKIVEEGNHMFLNH